MSDPDELALVFGREWPRILATLIRWTGSVQLAEDSVQEAFARAAESRDRALLINPGAWITTVAKRVAVDTLRRDAAMRVRLPQLVEDAPTPSLRDAPADDDLLGLLFLACSPLVSAETRLALALRFVCGVPTEAIADALLIEHRAMNARLTRAKHKIEHEGIRFASPDDEERDQRIDDVLSTVYVLYTTGHSAVGTTLGTTATAIELARALRRLRPENPEVAGLLSLLLLTEARASTRVSESGSLVTLEDADRRRWDTSLIREGLDLAVFALPGGGRFALQAGIAGLHAEAPSWVETDWTSIGALYDRLLVVWPSPAAAVARIVAKSYGSMGPRQALEELAALEPQLTGAAGRQAVAVRADLLRRTGRNGEAKALYALAQNLERHAPTRDYFGRRIAELDGDDPVEPERSS